ncbi:hypothetical protein PL321_10805 [Caloramator sp. mosi_1]|uniref:hypothetical protein n=1 Tax=Caloramator sp. mosi_1 TaxID=3023090 RepID=UPI002362AE3B|nr:hypothetical protein [Caloramator sp. mosi_1]WDC83268.1 hypothetical protein PL321_10805 [Caloramator sp. mosi_1]
MRNLLIDRCRGSWILMVDGDEVLENPEEIIDFLKVIYIKNIVQQQFLLKI